jgi:hypothetical protein
MFFFCMCSDSLAEKLRFKTKSTLPRIIKLRQTSKTINRKMSLGEVCTEQSWGLHIQSKEAMKRTNPCQVEAIIFRLSCC